MFRFSPLFLDSQNLRSRTNRPGPTHNSNPEEPPEHQPSWSDWAHGSGTTRIVANDFWSRQLWSWTHICHHPQRPTKSWQRTCSPLPSDSKQFLVRNSFNKKKLEKAHAVDAMINHFSTELLVESLSLEIVFFACPSPANFTEKRPFTWCW